MAEVIWQDRAIEEFEAIQDYLTLSFGESQTRKFTQRVFDFLDLLSKHPSLGPIQIKELDIRGFVLSKQTTILYKLIDNRLYVLSLIDNRMDRIF